MTGRSRPEAAVQPRCHQAVVRAERGSLAWGCGRVGPAP